MGEQTHVGQPVLGGGPPPPGSMQAPINDQRHQRRPEVQVC